MAYTGNSITDYLSSVGQNSSFSNRAKLASQYGVKNYTGSAAQNLSLLNSMKTKATTPATATKATTPAAPKAKAPTKSTNAPKVTPLEKIVNNTRTNTANLENQYKNSANVKTANSMMNATIQDLEKKYGFDFSRSYASKQAEAEAQAQRNAFNSSIRENNTLNQETISQIDSSVSEGNQALDHSFFQNYLQQRQQQANTGMNSGIAAEQDLRLGMNQQAQLASMYRDANLARNQETNRFNNESIRLGEALALVEQQRLAREDSLFQQLRQQAYETLSQERNTGINMDSNEWRKYQDRIAREMELAGMNADQVYRDAELLGLYGGTKTVSQLQREFQQEMERAQLKLQQDKFAWEKQMEAARLAAARAGGGGGRSSGGSSGGSSSSKSSSNSAVQAYNNAKKTTSAGTTAADKYVSNVSAQLNKGRSLARKPIEDLAITNRFLPNTINPLRDPTLSIWERNQIRLGR